MYLIDKVRAACDWINKTTTGTHMPIFGILGIGVDKLEFYLFDNEGNPFQFSRGHKDSQITFEMPRVKPVRTFINSVRIITEVCFDLLLSA
jgi:hypothetical protein